MDKIQELHGEVFVLNKDPFKAFSAHASITDDMMGRFAEWVEVRATN